MMKPVLKMGVIALVGICVVFYQYHLSFGTRLDQITALNQEAPPPHPPPASENGQQDSLMISNDAFGCQQQQKITEDMIRFAVEAVRVSNGLGPDIGIQLVEELFGQLAKPMSISSDKNNEKQSTTITPVGTPKIVGSALGANGCEPAAAAAADNYSSYADENPLYVITPTYRRPEQVPELTRMAHTLMLVKNVHWLVIEDAQTTTKLVTDLLKSTGIKYDHLVAPMPEAFKSKKGAKPRGVSNRNRGLQWLRANATRGVFYFADDDNTYDIRLFDEIRRTQKVSMWPVGLCTKFGLSTPIVKNEKFVGFYDGWMAGRKFPVDMAGFAVSVKFLLQRPKATMPFKPGYEEDGFLKSLAPFEPNEIELLGDKCTRVLAWHTQTKKNEPSAPLDKEKYAATNLIRLKELIV